MRDVKTLREFIREWTSQSEVPNGFVDEVLALLKSKGIDLDGPSAAYEAPLSKSFRFQTELHRTCKAIEAQLSEVTAGLELLRQRCLTIAERAEALEQAA